jgi:spermidine synthase
MNRAPVLFFNVLVMATCGLVYELLAGTLASYVLGDSVTQFSLVIGIYLFAMGVGAWLSRFIDRGLVRCFVEIEFCVALAGGCSAPLLLFSFARLRFFSVVLYGVVFVIGVLVGLELPLLMRILKDHLDFKELVSRVLALDYVGALVASILFPIFCMPRLGLTRTSLVFGLLNVLVGLWATWLLRPLMEGSVTGPRVRGFVVLAILACGLWKADFLTSLAEADLFTDPVVYARTTPYQRIVITAGQSGFQLFLNGHLQFHSADEYRYHEALVHPAMALAGRPRRVLVLGGGDGLALREVLKIPSVEAVTLVDLDAEMTGLSDRFQPLAELNARAFHDPRVEVVNRDAMLWLANPGPAYDVAIVDFPDPHSFAVGKLYTTRFYRLLGQRLAPDAAVAVQCTSPLLARKSFWCILRTLEAAGFVVRPYHAAVPSFGVWGFALARRTNFEIPAAIPAGLKFLTDQSLSTMFVLPADLGPLPVEINRLDNQVLVRYHDIDWRHWD